MPAPIPLSNVIRVSRDASRGLFVARIGPASHPLEASARNPVDALWRLAARLDEQGWAWDGGWLDQM
jgi:hypothetical protein